MTIFRRIRGRIVALGRGIKKQDKRDAAWVAGGLAVAAAAALAAGRLAPPGGLAGASSKMRKQFGLHAARAAGLVALGAGEVAVIRASSIVHRRDEGLGAGIATIGTAGVGSFLPNVTRIGKKWRTSSSLTSALKGTKYIPGL